MTTSHFLRLMSLLATLYTSMALQAQVFDLSAGKSTLYGAEGASVVIHSENSETTLGAGIVNGHFGGGGTSTRRLLGGTMTTGQQQFGFAFPTDIFDSGKVLSGTGVSFRLPHQDGRSLTGFLGFSSAEAGSPLFQSSLYGSPTAYLQWKQAIGDRCASISSVLLSTGDARSLLQSIECSPTSHVTVAVTGGVGGGDPYGAISLKLKERKFDLQASYNLVGEHFQRGTDLDNFSPEAIAENVSVEYRPLRSLSLSASHRNFFTPAGREDPSMPDDFTPMSRSSLDQASIKYHRSATTLGFTMLHSRSDQALGLASSYNGSNTASYTSFAHNFGRFEWSETLLHSSQSDGSSNTILVNGVSVPLNPHLHLTESVNVTSSGTNFSHGGTLVTRFSSFEVDYQLLYIANRPGNPFQQAMVFDAQARLFRDISLHAASSIGASGNTLYTFRLGSSFSRNAAAPEALSPRSLGLNVLRGRVVDEQGTPIEGAALAIGSTHVYADPQGLFFYREKSPRTHTLSVLVDEFMQLKRYSVVSAPRQVHTTSERDAKPVEIVMRLEPTHPSGEQSPRRSLEVEGPQL